MAQGLIPHYPTLSVAKAHPIDFWSSEKPGLFLLDAGYVPCCIRHGLVRTARITEQKLPSSRRSVLIRWGGLSP